MNRLSFLLLFVLVICKSYSQDNPNYYNMPSAKKVLNLVSGKNKEDTFIKQFATLDRLAKIADYQMHPMYSKYDKNNELMLAKEELKKEYYSSMIEVRQKYSDEIKPLSIKKNKEEWDSVVQKLSYDDDFRDNIVYTLFSDSAKKRFESIKVQNENDYNKLVNDKKERDQKKSQENFNNILAHGFFWIIMLSFLLLGAVLTIRGYNWRKRLLKYEFENTTSGGVVEFDDFGKAQKHNSNKTFSGILIFIGVVIFMITLLLINITIVNDKLF